MHKDKVEAEAMGKHPLYKVNNQPTSTDSSSNNLESKAGTKWAQ
jgi:hypothetical protein